MRLTLVLIGVDIGFDIGFDRLRWIFNGFEYGFDSGFWQALIGFENCFDSSADRFWSILIMVLIMVLIGFDNAFDIGVDRCFD